LALSPHLTSARPSPLRGTRRPRLEQAHEFTNPQLKWLDRTAKQVKFETVVDKASLDAGQFKAEGGFARLNKVFDGKLEGLRGVKP
jgi:type I restriction enzyme R subunit